MDVRTAWDNLSQAIAEMQQPGGDPDLKLATVRLGVEILFEYPAQAILDEVRRSSLSTRALVSWLLFEGERLTGVPEDAVESLRALYEATCPPGQGVIPPPRAGGRGLPS